MRVPDRLSRATVGFNMTPMIDIVFLLIVFFLVSSHLTSQEEQPDIDLPAAESGYETEQENPDRIVVNISEEGKLAVEGRTMTMNELRELIATRRKALGDGLEIQVRGHKKVPWKFAEPVLFASAMQGVWNVKFRVYRKQE